MSATGAAEENKNCSSESVVSLSYSEIVSFEEVKERSEDEDKDDFVAATDEGIDEDDSAVETEEDDFVAGTDNLTCAVEPVDVLESTTQNVYSSSDTLSLTLEELKDFASPAPSPIAHTRNSSSSTSSWSDTIEAFLDQLNDIDFDSDYERDILLKRGLKEPGQVSDEEADDEESEEEKVIEELRSGQGLLLCLAVPVLLSQIIMLLILTSTTSNAKTSIILRPADQIRTIHYHHYYHHHHHHYYYDPKKETRDGLAYVFFNPFGAICNSRYFKLSTAWISKEYRKQLNDPSSLVSTLSHYLSLYLEGIKSRVLKLNNVMDSEIGKALRVRDTWNRAVYDKIYKIASSPQYQRAVSTISRWAAAIKDRLFS